MSGYFFDETEIKKIADQILSTEIFEFAKEYFKKLSMLRLFCYYILVWKNWYQILNERYKDYIIKNLLK